MMKFFLLALLVGALNGYNYLIVKNASFCYRAFIYELGYLLAVDLLWLHGNSILTKH